MHTENSPTIMNLDLGDLTDPQKYRDPIPVSPDQAEMLTEQLKTILVIRRTEEKLAEMMQAGVVKCPCHLGIGQEAIAVGVSTHLNQKDRVFGTHRSHSHYIALGGSVESLFAEVLGKESGCAKGMGGSMHLFNEAIGFKGSVPIVAATVPLAVGAALAAHLDSPTKKNMNVGLAYFGDGTTEEGSVHESMNFASKFNLPMLFVVENNLFSSHLHIGLRQPGNSVARYAAAHGLNYEVVDGNNVVAVAKATEKLIQKARNGEGAGFLEAVTYRWRGHVGPSEDNDVGLKRGDELKHWKHRDPARRLKDGLIQIGKFSEKAFEKMTQEVADHIEEAWKKAEAAPYPANENLLAHVWKNQNDGDPNWIKH